VKRLLPGLLLCAACAATDDRAIIAELSAAAERNPRAGMTARVLDPAPYHIVGERRTATLALDPGKVPIVRARINGVALPCIIDTGTTHLVISAAAARRCALYLPETPPITLLTPGYDAKFRIGAPESLELGGMRLEGGIAIVPETRSGVARRLGIESDVHATIGTAVLSNFNVVFDFGKRELVLAPHGREPFAGVMWTEVRVNGVGRLMLIDSGANGIFLEPEFARELGLVSESEARRLRNKADRAQSSRFGSVRIEELALGQRVFRDIHAHVVELMDQPDKGGLLGIAGLGPHRWLVDYESKSLSLVELR
jgi:predicted aspartyl protease